MKALSGWHCPVCAEVEFDPGEGNRYAAAISALSNEPYHNTFSRYERGEATPLPAVVNLFRLLDKHPELLSELKD